MFHPQKHVILFIKNFNLLKMEQFDFDKLKECVRDNQIMMEKHPTADLFIFGVSTISRDYILWNDFNINCRGLIVDSTGCVKSRSFQKFFTFYKYISEGLVQLSEGQISSIPDCDYKIFEKIDGSCSILYWIGDIPHLASQRSFTSRKALRATEILHKKYTSTFGKLKKDRTYIFEAVYPEARVTVDYGDTEALFLIGVLDNKTGNDLLIEDIGFPIAHDYTLELKNLSNFEELKLLNLSNKEGFVVKFENGLRIKVKFPLFERIHKVVNQTVSLEKRLFRNQMLLKRMYSMPMKILNNLEIWSYFKANKSLHSILINISNFQYSLGMDQWVEIIYNQFINDYSEQDINLSHVEKCEKIKPLEIIEFKTVEKINLSSSELIMWNRLKRISELYE